jgi:hypothetical protein
MACAHALPQVRELAQAVGVAFDDLQALPGAEEGADAQQDMPVGTVARKVLGNAVDQAMRSAVRAVPKPVSQAARTARSALESSVGQAVAAAVPRIARQAGVQSVAGVVARKSKTRSR